LNLLVKSPSELDHYGFRVRVTGFRYQVLHL
jgi:hypothetical protein